MLTDKGQILSRTTVQHITKNEVQIPEIQQSIHDYHSKLHSILGEKEFTTNMDGFSDFINDDVDSGSSMDEDVLDWMGKYLGPQDTKDIDAMVDHSDARKQADTYDNFIGAEVAMPNRVGEKAMGRVVKRVKDNDGNALGTATDNPLTNTSKYEVKFPDGHIEELQYNFIASL